MCKVQADVNSNSDPYVGKDPALNTIFVWEHFGRVSPDELLAKAAEQITEGYIYAELEQAVCLGRCTQGNFVVRENLEYASDASLEILVAHIKMLRVFNENQEFRAVRVDEEFCWRTLSESEASRQKKLDYLEEEHKLWGEAVKQDKEWTLFADMRGARFWVPEPFPKGMQLALRVRNYFTDGLASTTESAGALLRFTDERLCAFVVWPA